MHLTILRQINKYFIEYNFFIAFCSVAFLFYFSLLMKFPFPASIYIFTFCATLSTYNLFRHYRTFEAFLSGTGEASFYLILAGITCAGICYFLLPFKIQVFYLVLGFFTLLYKFNLPGIRNLRSIPYLKLPVITISWLLSGSIFQLINIDQNTDLGRLAGLLAMQFCFIIALAITFDVFGLIEDEITTIPTRLGISKALWIAKILLVLYFIAAVIIHQRTAFLYAAGSTAAITFLLIHFSPKIREKSLQYYLLDGPIILQTVIFYLFLRYF